MLNAKSSFVALLAITPLFALQCGDSSEGSDDDKGGGTQTAGEGGEATGGSAGAAGTTTTGGRSGAGGSSTRGGSAGSGGDAGGDVGGEAGAPQGGQGNGGGSGAGQGGVGLGGEGGLAGEGGFGAEGGDGGHGGDPACEDPVGGGSCTGDLGLVGTGDFEVKFTITTSTTVPVAAIVQQRALCEHSFFWDARLVNGMVYFEVDDANANYVGCPSPVALNDGVPHRVVVRRVAGSLSMIVDCGAAMTCPSLTNLSTTLATLGNQTNNPCIGTLDGTVALDGTVNDVCVRPL